MRLKTVIISASNLHVDERLETHKEEEMSEDFKLLSAEEVKKEWLKISNTKLYQLVKDGKLPQPLKQGRCSFWKLGDIREYIEALPTAS